MNPFGKRKISKETQVEAFKIKESLYGFRYELDRALREHRDVRTIDTDPISDRIKVAAPIRWLRMVPTTDGNCVVVASSMNKNWDTEKLYASEKITIDNIDEVLSKVIYLRPVK